MTIVAFGIVFLIGATLGFRFKVTALFPAIGLVILGITATGLAQGDQGNVMIATVVVIAVALQAGYLLGIIARTIIMLSMAPAATRVRANDG
jgi:hypothetical protein